jgi:hypothetical protein
LQDPEDTSRFKGEFNEVLGARAAGTDAVDPEVVGYAAATAAAADVRRFTAASERSVTALGE